MVIGEVDAALPHGADANPAGAAHLQERVRELGLEQPDLEWLVNSIDGIVWEGRPNSLQFSFVSRQAERLLGYPLEDWFGPTFWVDHLHPEDREWAPAFCANKVTAGLAHDFEYRMIAADGRVVWLRDLVSLTTEPPIKVHGVMFDVTSTRQTAAALQASYRQVHELAASVMMAKEFERTRIARELHDSIGQQLAAASIALNTLEQRVPLELHDEVRRVTAILDEGISTVRLLSHELHPTMLMHSGLMPALTSHCNEFQRQHGLQVQFNFEEVSDIRGELAVAMFRIAQEALQNVARHARASSVRIGLRRFSEEIELTVEDDGVGFEPGETPRPTGLGLISIEERVRMIAGRLDLRSARGQGTRLFVRAPLLEHANSP